MHTIEQRRIRRQCPQCRYYNLHPAELRRYSYGYRAVVICGKCEYAWNTRIVPSEWAHFPSVLTRIYRWGR